MIVAAIGVVANTDRICHQCCCYSCLFVVIVVLLWLCCYGDGDGDGDGDDGDGDVPLFLPMTTKVRVPHQDRRQ